MSEHRAAARHPVVVPALCLRGDGSEFHAVTVDISSEGLRLRSATLPAVDERLVCNIRDIGSAQVRVVWAGTRDFAVRVIGHDPFSRRRGTALHRAGAPASEVVRGRAGPPTDRSRAHGCRGRTGGWSARAGADSEPVSLGRGAVIGHCSSAGGK
ncbi:PilZ domain-containing protein [Methylobacterium sp. E-066]|uniref:PilZ domain-containing protein n=1 Tax=Methylobacterium sp. E-066 TaxID=2836584 RepID=UPI003919C3A1